MENYGDKIIKATDFYYDLNDLTRKITTFQIDSEKHYEKLRIHLRLVTQEELFSYMATLTPDEMHQLHLEVSGKGE